MVFASREEVIEITADWSGERFPDGRPRVPDKYLDALKELTLEGIWKELYQSGYGYQFLRLNALRPEFNPDGTLGPVLIGRALTASYGPLRPDLRALEEKEAAEKGLEGWPNQWVIDSLQERDVAVIDMFDKRIKGTFIGGNLLTAIKNRTKTGGAVIWGGIRDLSQIKPMEDVQVYYRDMDPSWIMDFMMLSYNRPVCLGQDQSAAVCLPGDVVYGSGGGVLFIPPALVVKAVDAARKAQAKDAFGFKMLREGRMTAAQVDKENWTIEYLDMLCKFIREDPVGEPYRDISWDKEYENAKKENN